MPVYDFRCSECGHEFTELLSISRRNEPVEAGCPQEECDGEVKQVIGAVQIGYNSTSWMKPTDSFQDRMKDLKKQHAKTNTIGNAIR